MARLLDANVLLNIIPADPVWLDWSTEGFRAAAKEGQVLLNPVIYADLAPAFDSQAALDRWLRPTIFNRLRLPFEAGYRAGQAFVAYRERGGAQRSPLPDFYLDARAKFAGHTLVTRDLAGPVRSRWAVLCVQPGRVWLIPSPQFLYPVFP